MKEVRVQEAVGMTLCHDITRVAPGEFKGRAFKKGHVITLQDIPELLRLGKEHIYVWEPEPGKIHENEGAVRLGKAVAGQGLEMTEPREGKVKLLAAHDGVLRVNRELQRSLNLIGQLSVSGLHDRLRVARGQQVAGAGVIPLLIEEERISRAEGLCQVHGPVYRLHPFKAKKVYLVTTGSEVFHGRVPDGFGPVIRRKVEEEYHSTLMRQTIVPDGLEVIEKAIREALGEGADMVVVSGGMSVDPDDRTPGAIGRVADRIVTHGAPVLPGAMFMLAYRGHVPIMGLPACVMFNQRTILDLVLPPVFADLPVTAEDIAEMGYGGLCMECPECRYPICPFGKG